MKKIFARFSHLIALALLVAFILTGCSNTITEPVVSTPTFTKLQHANLLDAAVSSGTVTLQVAFNAPAAEAFAPYFKLVTRYRLDTVKDHYLIDVPSEDLEGLLLAFERDPSVSWVTPVP